MGNQVTVRMIESLLVANRGEIACRVIRTAKRLGIRTVAVYSDADRGALHTELADSAVHIGAAPAADSYLDISKIIRACTQSCVDAVHPGYGFLAENDAFAAACIDAGITLVGPPVHAIQQMGNKRQAKLLMIDAGVPCIPGYEGAAQDDATLVAEAKAIGMPVMIKAAAGGGGRGMRLCEDEAQLGELIHRARSEAEGAFASGELILEKAVVGARHVEIQVFADTHGNVVHLGERDCSVQRRHQKIIEESPSPAVDSDLRAAMGEAAIKAAESIGYVGAGTVEFLLAADGQFYFLEMNTRLQVEHPVTEMVTGTDLVEWQIRVAEGRALPKSQEQIEPCGHAIEVRVCAEDPLAGFVPQAGKVLRWQVAGLEAGPQAARCDSALPVNQSGLVGEVSPYYDSMVAKIIVHAATREEALRQLVRILGASALHGVVTNLDYLRAILVEPDFAEGQFDTNYLDSHDSASLFWNNERDAVVTAAFATVSIVLDDAAALAHQHGLESSLLGWHSSHPHPETVILQRGEEVLVCQVQCRARLGDGVSVQVNGEAVEFAAVARRAGELTIQPDQGASERVMFSRADNVVWVTGVTGTEHFTDITYAAAEGVKPGADGRTLAASDGRVIEVKVAVGDTVDAGATLVIVEAMKMEFHLTTPVAGVVKHVNVVADAQVSKRQLLVELDVIDAASGGESVAS